MGVTGIHAEHGLTTGDREEAAVKRAICRQAAETVVLGSWEKLGDVSAYSVAGLDDVDGLIVSAGSAPRGCSDLFAIEASRSPVFRRSSDGKAQL